MVHPRPARTGALSILALPLTAVLAVAACSLTVDVDGLSGAPPSAAVPDGGTGGGGGAGGGAPACIRATFPPAPEGAPEGADVSFAVAVRSIDMGETSKALAGLDLDKTCTCQGEGPSCTYPVSATANHCDSEGGRDNSLAQVFAAILKFAGMGNFSSEYFSGRAEKGYWSLILRVFEYNGGPDDGQVSVALYPTYYDDTFQSDDPNWDGKDIWSLSVDALEDGASADLPRFVDKNAYVAGGVVVASLPEAVIALSGESGNLGIKLTAGTVMGRIEEGPTGRRLRDAVIAGRWRTADIFKAASSFQVSGASLCKDGGFGYTTFKSLICSHIDIASSLGTAATMCDSLSFGMSFQTEPAIMGMPFTPAPPPDPCPPGTDPSNDFCEGLAPGAP